MHARNEHSDPDLQSFLQRLILVRRLVPRTPFPNYISGCDPQMSQNQFFPKT